MSNGGVDATAQIHTTFARSIILRGTLPPLASTELLGGAATNSLHLALADFSTFASIIRRYRVREENTIQDYRWAG
jgi:hypothetical protein